MGTGADVRDILELTGGENDGPISKKDLINSDKVRESHTIPITMPVPVFTSYPCHFTQYSKSYTGCGPFSQKDIMKVMLLFLLRLILIITKRFITNFSITCLRKNPRRQQKR